VIPPEVAEALEAFRAAGRTLFSFGLVKGSEGNLSTFDGSILVITRAGSKLDSLGPHDLVAGSIGEPLPGGSSDLEVHRETYAVRGPGAIAHCHPLGTVPEGGGGPGKHGVYAFGVTLDAAAAACVGRAREG
jgi:ribulose-5-phosphate 4-epimerase/fuculose-1-phosphate aldolase